MAASGNKKSKKTKTNPCDKCNGACCRYLALPIETPEDKEDYDDIRWYLCHEGITVFVEDGDWYINIENKCRHLRETDYKCDIYETRPKICRGYSADKCDLIEGEYEYELHFLNDKQMAEYIAIKFGNNEKQKQKVRQKAFTGRKTKGK